MSQNDYVIANQTTPLFRTDLNLALQALASNSSGSSAPVTTYANMMWYDTTANILKMRNEADSAWINLGTLDQGANTFSPSGLTTLAQATWNTGTSTTESLISPLKLATAITAAAPVIYTSTLTTWSISATPYTFTHGLGQVPNFVSVTLVCKIADGGWAVGDEVDHISDLSGVVRGVLPARNSTSVIVKVQQNVYLPTKTTASFITPTSTNWNIRVRAGL